MNNTIYVLAYDYHKNTRLKAEFIAQTKEEILQYIVEDLETNRPTEQDLKEYKEEMSLIEFNLITKETKKIDFTTKMLSEISH